MPEQAEPATMLLTLPEAEMRALGYRVVDLLVDHFAGLGDQPVGQIGRLADLEALIDPSLPETPLPAADVLSKVVDEVLPYIMHTQHPRFMAFVPSPSNYVSVLADALVAGFNPFAGTWMEASGPAVIEARMIRWLSEICQMPPSSGGLFTSGGSAANLTALAAARHARLGNDFARGVIYFSNQTHSSVIRALKVLGIRSEQLRILPADSSFRLSAGSLRRAIAADRQDGLKPFCVVANAGTTNTGAVDALSKIAGVCETEGLWLHVDGAYGAAAAILPDQLALFDGIGRADSLVIDPHKWLFQPYEIGCVLVRDTAHLHEAFHILPEYLQDLQVDDGEINFCDYGIQLTRSFRALKLWMSVQTFGLAAFRKAVRRGIELAEIAERRIRRSPSFELVTPAQIGVLTFRFVDSSLAGDLLNDTNRRIVEGLKSDGRAFVSSTSLNGQTVLRICSINPRTTEANLEEVLDRIEHIGRQLI